MQVDFAFEIGAVVALKLSPRYRCQIITRLAEEHTGGIIKSYVVRIARSRMVGVDTYDIHSTEFCKLLELELLSMPPETLQG